MTDTLPGFLADRVNEEGVWAQAALAANGESRARGLSSTLWDDEDRAAHRTLREVEAKLAILTRYEDCLARMEDPDYPAAVARDQAREYEDFVLPPLAAIYSDHPDYRQEWRP